MYQMCQDLDESSLCSSFWSSEEEQEIDEYELSKVQTGEDASDEDTGTDEDNGSMVQFGKNVNEEDACSDGTSVVTSGYGTFRPEDQHDVEERDSCGEGSQMRYDKVNVGSRDSFYDDSTQGSEDDERDCSGGNISHGEQKEPENQQPHWRLITNSKNEDDYQKLGQKPEEYHQSELHPDISSEDEKKTQEEHQYFSYQHPDTISDDVKKDHQCLCDLHPDTSDYDERNSGVYSQSDCNLQADTRNEDLLLEDEKKPETLQCDLQSDTRKEDEKPVDFFDPGTDEIPQGEVKAHVVQQLHCDLQLNTRNEDFLQGDKMNHHFQYERDPDTIQDYIPHDHKKVKPEQNHPHCDLHHDNENDVPHEVENKPDTSYHDSHHKIGSEDKEIADHLHEHHPDTRSQNVLDEDRMNHQSISDLHSEMTCEDEAHGHSHIWDDKLSDKDEAVSGLLFDEGDEHTRNCDKNIRSQESESSKKIITLVDSQGNFELEGNIRHKDCSSLLQNSLSELHINDSENENDKASVLSDDEMVGISLSSFGSSSTRSTRTRSESDLQTKPKSFIRPVVNQRTIKKMDPVSRYFQYKQLWDGLKLPGERDHRDLRWAIRERLAYQPEAPKAHRTYVANSYVVPTEKKRSALRWEVRNQMAHPDKPHMFTYRF
ncbi:sarcoplasmic reticulum histidine-rich calcium-binding protein isoform X1 [Corythoichthys intestinalis]|uniref:sarcoplasmic reticulum histidine-rich calcium-binding protein isoform X1 n=1 Tax=Corythoichthys intestinalis TaxID=161448 RepID=UPI0025A59107|nr:sarcoplasmic reticulum histidine-rich calcium-binding protein isoform X1 [Corythoichthys intestinalis]